MRSTFLILTMLGGAPALTSAQGGAAPRKIARVVVQPTSLRLAVGDSAKLDVQTLDSAGATVETDIYYRSRSKRGVTVGPTGWVKATYGGQHTVAVIAIDGGDPVSIPVTVTFPALARIDISAPQGRALAGSQLSFRARAFDQSRTERPEAPLTWNVSDAAVATVSQGGVLTAIRAGRVELRAQSGSIVGRREVVVERNPIRRVVVTASQGEARTGDVVRFTATAFDAAGQVVRDAPIRYAVTSEVEDTVIAQSPSGDVDQKGRFVAQKAGRHTVVAVAAGVAGQATVSVRTRGVTQTVKIVGRAPILGKGTADLFLWEGKDGRDYMVVGTFSSQAYFYDVTNPAAPALVDSVVVDARAVNDVFVDPTGSTCVITREGASTRRNGIVILDCSNPRDVKILSTFDDGLWGGVHNVNIWKHYVFAVNDGVPRFDIIDIADPRNPKRAAVFELTSENPGKYLHDVWLDDGIAYASYWDDGVILIDVGNGKHGGTPEKPVQFAQYKYPLGTTHAAYPFRSSTGKFYVITGDEMGPPNGYPRIPGVRQPGQMGGYAHVIDFTDPSQPEEVARYEVTDAGSHNFWIDGQTLYTSFYNGGMRVVDISGEMKGNLTLQGREIAKFLPFDDKSSPPNSPMVMGPQLYKGNVWMADMTSGIWAIKLEPKVTVP